MAAKGSNFVQPAKPKFDGHYDHWAMLMQNLLRSKEYQHLVETRILTVANGVKPTKAQRKTIKEQQQKDLKVKKAWVNVYYLWMTEESCTLRKGWCW